MQRYEVLSQIGDGSFGRVFKAKSKETGSVYAIKELKQRMKSWEESISLREISLCKLSHPNIVTIYEMMLEREGSLYFVFEYMPDGSLYELTKRCIETNERLPNALVQSYGLQLLNALSFLHDEKSYFHRDIKPENVLVSGKVIKLADFGLCRDIGASSPFTYYVSTRWYRAPEVILRSASYGPPIDLFATGLILAELYSLKPLLPGSSEIDQIKLMINLIGSPTPDWEEGVELMQRMKLVVPPSVSTPGKRSRGQSEVELRIQQTLPKDVPSAAANLIAQLLSWNPHSRRSASECMQHELFCSKRLCEKDLPQMIVPSTVKRSNISSERNRTVDHTPSRREATKLPFPLKTDAGAGANDGDDTNEFNNYLAAVSNSSRYDGTHPTSSSSSSRVPGNKIRPLLFEKENRSIPEESLPSYHDTGNFQPSGFDFPKSARKVKSKSNNRKGRGHHHRRSGGISSMLGRGIQVQISNSTSFASGNKVANIWDGTEETNNFDENEFNFM